MELVQGFVNLMLVFWLLVIIQKVEPGGDLIKTDGSLLILL